MNYDSFLELVRTRRTIRSFKPDPVPHEYVEKIIEAARWAPSGANSQPWELVVVEKKELRDGIVKIFDEGDALAYRMEQTREPEMRVPVFAEPPKAPASFAIAPVFIIICGDPRTRIAYPIRDGINRGQSIYTSSLANTCLYMMLAAATLGLGTRWVTATGIPFEQCLIKELLGIPQELEIYDTVIIGYPDSEPKPRPRKSVAEIAHHDHYDRTRFKTAEQVKETIISRRRG